jgi:hypothetical protein
MEETTTEVAAPAPKGLLIFLGAMLLLALITTFTFYTNWRETEEQLQAAKLANSEYEKDSFRVSNLIQKNKGDREILASADYRSVVLRGTAKAPGSLALAFYNPSSRELLVDVSRLPEAPAGQQYQLWSMDGDKATDAGVLSPDKMNEGLLKMNPIAGVKSLTLTLEKAGGAASPTMAEAYLTGSL